MSKSKYPNKIDTSLELPVIKDNLTELRASVFNSYRSAIIQLEKTLGINPQGYDGNTVAERLNMSLDEYGFLKDDAIDKLNLVKGPVKNINIANEAGIEESKLNLDFSTNFLYNQVIILKRFLDEIDSAINDISVKLSNHLNIASLNSHIANAIDIEEDVSSPQSTIALKSLESQSLQEFAKKIIFSHINFLGSEITSENNSHKADQIYFDNTVVQDIISSNSMQKAVEELANLESSAIKKLVINLAKNSRLRSGKISNPEGLSDSRLCLSSFSCSVLITEGSNKTNISLTTPKAESISITNGDFLRLSGYSEEEYNKDYLIESVIRNGSSEVSSISIFGFLPKTQISGLKAEVFKNNIQDYNNAGLHQGIRYLKNYTNLPYVIIGDPNSARITASESNIHGITSSSNLTIGIDGTDHIIDIFDSDVYSSLGFITLDSIINKINKYSSENSLPIYATYSFVNSKKELTISHLIPNISEDLNTRSLKITESSINDASSSLGFSVILDKIFYGSGSNSSFVNGTVIDEYFKYKKLTSGFLLNKSTSTITRSTGSFVEDGFISGSLILIEDALSSSDNGVFIIKKSEPLKLTLDHFFNDGNSSATSIMYLNNIINLSEFEFDNMGTSDLLTTNGSILFNSFYDSYSKNVFVKKRLEVENLSKTFGSNNSLNIINISKNFIKNGETGNITINTDLKMFLTDSSGNNGDSILITNSGRYTLYDKSKEGYVIVDIHLASSLALSSDYIVKLYGYGGLSSNVLPVGSFLYSTQLGKTIGDSESIGVPSLENMVDSGYVDEKRISESFYSKYINLPREELVGDGVVFGLKTTLVNWNSTTKELIFNLEGGICYVGGKRLEINEKENLTYTLDGSYPDYWYLFINEYGEIKLEKEINFNSEKYSSVFNQEIVLLSYFYQASSTSEFCDLRYFIDKITKKISTNILVAPSSLNKDTLVSISKNESHFGSLKDAVKYCKKIKKAAGSSFTPRIILLEGYHYVSSTVYVDFDLEIYGVNNKSFITQELFSSITGRIYTSTDLSTRATLSTDHSLITLGQKGNYSNRTCNYFKIKNVNFHFKSNASLLCAIYVNEHFNLDEKSKLIVDGCNFISSGSDIFTSPYSSGSYFRFSIPILITNPSSTSPTPISADYSTLSGAYEFNRSFKNMYFYNNTFHGFSTNGYCILFQVYDSSLSGSYQIKNVVARDNLIKACRQHTTLSKNQLFSFVKNIEDVNLVDSNHATFTNVVEENTMVEP